MSESDLAARFAALKREWQEEAAHLSSPSARDSAAYRDIVALGPAAVPPLLEDLHQGWWFRALREITGEDPVPAAERGDRVAMVRRWTAWVTDEYEHVWVENPDGSCSCAYCLEQRPLAKPACTAPGPYRP